MNFEMYRLHIHCPAFRRCITTVCHSAKALDSLVQIYEQRMPGCRICVRRRRLVFEMVGGVCYLDAPLHQLEETETFSWDAHIVKTIVGSREHFDATAKEVKEKIETAKTDDSIICMALFVEEGYELQVGNG